MEVECIALVPIFQISRPSTSPRMEYAAKLKSFLEGIRLMSVDVEVIEIMTNEVIPTMSLEEHARLNQDLYEINELRLEESGCALDLTKI